MRHALAAALLLALSGAAAGLLFWLAGGAGGAGEDVARLLPAVDGARVSRQQPRLAVANQPPVTLLLEGWEGTIVYSDENCAIRSVQLPWLIQGELAQVRACRFDLSPDGQSVIENGTWKPDGSAWARCVDGTTVEQTNIVDGLRTEFAGCAPAWSRDGQLTFVRHEEVLEYRVGRAPRVLIPRADLLAALRSHPDVESTATSLVVDHLGWFDSHRSAVLVSALSPAGAPTDQVLAVFEGRVLVRARPLLGRRLIDLRISPQGTWAWGPAARADAFLIVDRDGRVAPLALTPTDFRGIAWSPNENLVAVASGDRIYVIETGSHYENLTQLEISARDLTWR